MASIEERYIEMLDEAYGTISICGVEYAASVALQRIDPIAYRVGLSDFESSLEDEQEKDTSIDSDIRNIIYDTIRDHTYDPYGSVMNAIEALGVGAHLAGYGAFVPSEFFRPSVLGVAWGCNDHSEADEIGYALDGLTYNEAERIITYWVRVLSEYHALVVRAGRDY